jgi:hypothetical protein
VSDEPAFLALLAYLATGPNGAWRMTIYLDLARSVFHHGEQSEKREVGRGAGLEGAPSPCDISEESEKRASAEYGGILSEDEAAQLKAQIIAAVTVEPACFDRAAYDALVAKWDAHEAALLKVSHNGQVA